MSDALREQIKELRYQREQVLAVLGVTRYRDEGLPPNAPESPPTRATYWRCCSMHDSSGRRGIWFAVDPQDRDTTPLAITIRAGREGDDVRVSLKVGEVVTAEIVKALQSALACGAWMQEEEGPGTQLIPT